MRKKILRPLRAPRGAALAARRGFLRLSDKKKIIVKQPERPPSAHPIAALVPMSAGRPQGKGRFTRRSWAGDEPRPSQARMTKHMRMVLTQYAIILCLILSVSCALAVPILSSVRVNNIRVEGAVHYTESHIVSLSDVNIGDELFAHDLREIEARLKEKCPYLLSVHIQREHAGLSITITESVPRWALLLSDGRVALVDGNGYICEVCEQNQVPEELCVLSMPLPMVQGEDDKELLQPQVAVAGKYITGTSPALTLLAKLSSVLDTVVLPAKPVLLDLSDIYSVTLTLSDGTQFLLHECDDPERQLSRAVSAIESYVAANPDVLTQNTLLVDVDDLFRVSIRSVPKISQKTDGETE